MGRRSANRIFPHLERLGALLGVLVTLPLPAAGDDALTTQKDVQVAVRVLDFVASPPSGATPMAIVYAPGNTLSMADANAIRTYLQADRRPGKAELQPTLVKVADVERLAGVRFAFVTHGLEPFFSQIAQATRDKGMLSISSDTSCTESSSCVLAITSEPRVHVTVNRVAALEAHIEFSTGFRMLINEQ